MTTVIDGVTYTTYTYGATTEATAVFFDNTLIETALNIPFTVDIGGTSYPVTKVSNIACSGRSALVSLGLPDTIRTLEAGAFSDCTNLQTVIIASTSSLLSLEGGVFSGCTALTSFFIPNSLLQFNSGNNFLNCTSLQVSFGTSPSFTQIAATDFKNCTSLTAFTFPASLTTIGNGAFDGCTSLTTCTGFATLPSLTVIPDSCFKNCPLSATFTISDSVTTIAGNAFDTCKFETLIIGSGFNTTSANCIVNCNSLTTVTCNATILLGNSLTNCVSLNTINGSLTTIQSNAIYNCCGVSLYLGDSITTVEPTSINSSTLETIRWPSNTLEFPAGGVGTLPALTSYTNIDNVTTLNANFLNQTAVTSFTVLPSVTNPLPSCLSSCPTLTTVTWATDANIPNDCCSSYFIGGVENFVITGRPTAIGDNAFALDANLVNLTIPNSVTSITTDASTYGCPFFGCTKLLSPTEVSPGVYQGTVTSNSQPLVGGVLSAGQDFVYNYFNPAGTNGIYVNYIYDPLCFAHGTKILCLTADLQEEYVPIEKLTSGSIVKTYKHGYRKIYLIGKGHMINDVNRPHSCMYTMKKTDTNGLIEDLTLTGGHSILVDDMSDDTKAKVTELLGSLITIDDKFLHVCSIHPDFQQVQDKEVKAYYHFILENNNDDDRRYAVYANGILAETPSFNQFIKHNFTPL